MFRRADADAADLALALEAAEALEGAGVAVPGAGPSVELEEVDVVGLEVAERALEALAEVGLGVAAGYVVVGGGGPLAGGGRDLGGDVDAVVGAFGAALFEGLGDDAFGLAVAV